ncbi:CDP-alcohol phosphatidyltransferase family protein [Lolliginicoccus levis]|uniref:CDP-alcohol phosphatidyltransferase family protein n=1 Tax=Lolliginicoccus levis TaxID=2919542 RepID=UPI00241E738B|nr:CDP-alcohol phosphatidyltransferase family protein [Lolliginicoccus levis]
MRTPEPGSRPPMRRRGETYAEYAKRIPRPIKSEDYVREIDELAAEPPITTDRIWTIPNALSMLRLAGVPVFLVLLLVYQLDAWALWVLIFSGISDWLDGKLARLLNQTSKLGAILDPLADRLYMFVIPIAFAWRDFIPWWVVALLVGRDVILASMVPFVRGRGVDSLPVTYLGKAATFALMYAFPVILAAQGTSTFAAIMEPIGHAMLIWGLFLYLWTMVLYVVQVRLLVRAYPRLHAER